MSFDGVDFNFSDKISEKLIQNKKKVSNLELLSCAVVTSYITNALNRFILPLAANINSTILGKHR